MSVHKLDMPDLVAYLNQTPINEWYVVGATPRTSA
jgi:hypothetical protein